MYKTNPHLGPQAMADLLLPTIGRVRVSAVQSWLENARTVDIGLDRLRLYRQCVEDYTGLVPESTPNSIVAFLKKDFNIKVSRFTAGRLLEEIQQPAGLLVATAEQLDSHEVFLLDFQQQEPNASCMQILQALQRDVGVTATIRHINLWVTTRRARPGCRRVICKEIPESFWKPLLCDQPQI